MWQENQEPLALTYTDLLKGETAFNLNVDDGTSAAAHRYPSLSGVLPKLPALSLTHPLLDWQNLYWDVKRQYTNYAGDLASLFQPLHDEQVVALDFGPQFPKEALAKVKRYVLKQPDLIWLGDGCVTRVGSLLDEFIPLDALIEVISHFDDASTYALSPSEYDTLMAIWTLHYESAIPLIWSRQILLSTEWRQLLQYLVTGNPLAHFFSKNQHWEQDDGQIELLLSQKQQDDHFNTTFRFLMAFIGLGLGVFGFILSYSLTSCNFWIASGMAVSIILGTVLVYRRWALPTVYYLPDLARLESLNTSEARALAFQA